MQAKSGGSLIGKLSCYLQIVDKDPHSTAFVPLADAFRQIGLLDDALAAARQGTAALPNFSPGFATLGRILGQMGRLDEAMTAYRQALEIDRQSQAALVGMARLHLIQGDRELARQVLLQAAQFHPEDEMVLNMLLALDLPRPWASPAAVAPAAVAAAPVGGATAADAEAEVAPIPTATLAEIYLRQGLVDQAIRVYEEILRLEPGNAAVLGRLDALRGSVAGEPAVAVTGTVPTAPPQPTTPSLPREPLAVFESWLRAIALRRAHVQ